MKIAVIGIGHVGLVTGLVFATKGHDVTCLEKNPEIIESLCAGKSHIYEPGIEELLHKTLEKGHLKIVPSTSEHLNGSEVVFICVNTPIGPNGIDFTQLNETLKITGKMIASADHYVTVVIKSTVVPGTTNGIVRESLEAISGKKCHRDFGLAANPEFLREGNGIEDFLNADRIIIGSDHKVEEAVLLSIYEPWNCDRVLVNTNTAEFIKYHSNILLSVLLSYTNEMANIASLDHKIDFKKVLEGVTSDKRLSPILEDASRIYPGILSYLVPGPGYGGSCLPKDLEAFAYYANSIGLKSQVLDAVIQTNEDQASAVLKLMKLNIGELKNKRILVLGLTHKPDTNDIRESAAIKISKLLLQEEAHLSLHDPVVASIVEKLFTESKNFAVVQDWEKALNDTDIVLLMTGWSEYQRMADTENASKLHGKQIVDTRYFFDPADFELSHYISF